MPVLTAYAETQEKLVGRPGLHSDQRELFMRIQGARHIWRGSKPGAPWMGRRHHTLFRAAGLTELVVDGQFV